MIQAILTIDDIPSENTYSIVDYLNANMIPAIMFAVGNRIEKTPAPAVYAIQHGIIVGNHGYAHPHFSELTVQEGIQDIEKCESLLDQLYSQAGVKRTFRPFRFPYGDKGGTNKAAFQAYLSSHGFNKVNDAQIPYPWWREQGLDRDIDTLWTFDFAEYNIREGSHFTMDDVWARVRNPSPEIGAALFSPDGRHILLLHAHDDTEALVPKYYALLLDDLLRNHVQFVAPEFL